MNNLKIFNSAEFGEIRTITKDGEPWFVGKDVAEILGYTNPSKALADHVDEEDKLNNESLSSLGQRGGWLINESGLYSLVLSSKLPTAKQFKRWITHEVIPSIRKHGVYAVDAVLNDPDMLIAALQELKAERAKSAELSAQNAALSASNELMRPQAEYFQALAERGNSLSLRETAKLIGVKEKVFVNFLINKKYLYRDQKGRLHPYAEKVGEIFEIKETINPITGWTGTQTLVTVVGRERFLKLCAGM